MGWEWDGVISFFSSSLVGCRVTDILYGIHAGMDMDRDMDIRSEGEISICLFSLFSVQLPLCFVVCRI